MANSALFGNYWAADSPLHRMDPRAKLVGLLIVMVATFAAQGYAGLGVVALAVIGLFACARIPLAEAFKSVAPLLFIVVLTVVLNLLFVQGGDVYLSAGPFRISEQGVHTAAFLGARLTLLLLAASLLTLTTTTLDITDATEALLAPFSRIGIPAHEFAMVLGIALRFVPQFVIEAHSIRTAQLARGAQASSNPRGWLSRISSLVVPLFASAFRHAETLSSGMDARCYHGGVGRSRIRPLAFRKSDALALAGSVCLILCVMAANYL